MDCDGDCNGTVETYYYHDYDGDGDGSTAYGWICDTELSSVIAVIGHDLVNNQDDTDDACQSNFHDDCGICDGPNVIADCCLLYTSPSPRD